MAVPESIRKVPRPSNTIVQDSGSDGPRRYIVRSRKSEKYIPNGNPQPINGKTVGYIIDSKFVPVKDKTASDGPQSLSYGMSALVKTLAKDILDDLLEVFPANDAYTILAMAAVKVIRPRVSSERMSSAYSSSFLCKWYPGAALSKNSVSSMYQNIGKDGKKREGFFERRLSRVMDEHHVAIDGTLKQDTSRYNDLSSFSYKARLKGCRDISILYAYDIELMEPVCCQVFPGNSIDAVSYRSFIRDNNINKGIIVADKGFPPNSIREELSSRPDLHYLTPVRRNDRRISSMKMLDFEGVIPGIDKTVQYKKAKTSEGLYLYSFRDAGKAAAEEYTYLNQAKEKDSYAQSSYEKKKGQFGLIIFESDKDIDPRIAYLCYADRWKLEMVFKAYKSDDCLDRTSVQGDFSIIGSEFVNFISTLVTCRIISKATSAGILEEMSYGDMLQDLNAAWRKTGAPEGDLPETDDIYWVHTIPKTFETLERLGLSKPIPKKEPDRPGRRPGSKNKPQAASDAQKSEEKRPVGRPRKKPPADPDAPKRPVGRPRIKPLPDPDEPKRSVGRPRKNPPPDPNQPKRPVGRPRKQGTIIVDKND